MEMRCLNMRDRLKDVVDSSLTSAARVLGKKGGLKGGKARWADKSGAERSMYGRMMAEAKKLKRSAAKDSDKNAH
jgi:hypothetical protein